jgi:chromosome segregation ATPase
LDDNPIRIRLAKRRPSPTKLGRAKQPPRFDHRAEKPWNADDDDAAFARTKCDWLQKQIDMIGQQIRVVEGELRSAHAENADLYRRNSELECHVASLRKAAAESNRRMLDAKAQCEDKATEIRASWEFQLNELMMEIGFLQENS